MATSNTSSEGNADYFELSDSSGGLLGDSLDLQAYMRILRKYKWLIVLFTAAVTGLAGYYAYTATPIYQSTSTLLIESQRVNVVSVEELVGLETENTDYYQTQFELLKSRELAKRVIDSLGLMDHPEFSAGSDNPSSPSTNEITENQNSNSGSNESVAVEVDNDAEPDVNAVAGVWAKTKAQVTGLIQRFSSDDASVDVPAGSVDGVQLSSQATPAAAPDTNTLSEIERERIVISKFLRNLTITPVRKTKLVKLSFESADRELAAQVANAVGEQYILAYLDAKLDTTMQLSGWLNGQIDTLKGRLEDSEQRLIEYKRVNGLVDAGGSVTGVQSQQIMLLTQELLNAQNQLAEAASIRRETRNIGGNLSLLETLPSVQADPLVREAKLQIGQQQRELDELSTRYGQRHPKIRDANSQLVSLQSTLQQNVNRIVGTIEQNYQLASQRVASLRASLAEGESRMQDTSGKTFDLEKLEREVETNREIYDEFRTRKSEAQSAEGLETPNARISDPAVPSSAPIKPKKALILALAALGALILSCLMAFLYEQMDDTVKSAEDVEKKLGVPMLGILPLIKGSLFGGKKSLPLNPAEIKDKKGTFSESINTARTAICLGEGDEARKIILVTSSVPGEGKSTTSLNLAYALSQMEKTILIDCDLRRPTIAKAINVPPSTPGLSNLISGTITARDCVQQKAIGELDVICSGPTPDQPLELLSSNRFAKMIDQLAAHYDRIVIDCAPTQAVSDALVLSQIADAVVYNVKSHDTSIALVKRGLARLRQVKANIAGVLITQVDIDKLVSYGGDYYYQGYYDYYGYNNHGEKSKGKLAISADEMAKIQKGDDDMRFDFGLADGEIPASVSSRYLDDDFDSTAALGTHEMGINGKSNYPRNRIKSDSSVMTNANGSAGFERNAKRRYEDDLDLI